MAYPHKWSPISYKSSAGQRKHIGQRPSSTAGPRHQVAGLFLITTVVSLFSSVFGRLIDVLILHRYSDVLGTCDLQFGFKAKRTTAMCSMVLKAAISYYVNHGSSVFCVFLDATKAFGRVQYCLINYLTGMLIRFFSGSWLTFTLVS